MRETDGGLPRAVWLLLLGRAVNRLGAFSLPFLAVLICVDFHTSASAGGLVAGALGVASIPSRLAGGRLADRIGPRRTIVLGLAGCAAAQIGIATAGSLAAVTVSAVGLGLAFELYEPPSQAAIAVLVAPGPVRTRAYSMLSAAFAVGGMGAGLLAAALGRWDLRWLFVADAASCLAGATVIGLALPRDRQTWAAIRARRSGVAGPAAGAVAEAPAAEARDVRPWRDPALLALLAAGTGFALVYSQVTVALPLALTRGGFRATDAGYLYTASALTVIAAQPLLRLRRLATLPGPETLALGCLLLAGGLAGYAVSDSLPAYVAATVLWSLGEFLFLGRAFTVVADLAPPEGTARYLAVYGLSWGFAGVLAPVLGTRTLDALGSSALWCVLAVASLILAAAYRLAVRRVLGTGPSRARRL